MTLPKPFKFTSGQQKQSITDDERREIARTITEKVVEGVASDIKDRIGKVGNESFLGGASKFIATREVVDSILMEILEILPMLVPDPIPGPPGESIQGPPGPQGDKGDTPILGVDYDIPDPIPGEPGKPGKDADEKKIIKAVLDKIELPTKEEIIEEVLKKIPKPSTSLGGAIHRGGGINVLTATGTIDGANATFTFTSIPKLVNVNGAFYQNGAGVTITGTTAVLDNAPLTGSSVYGLS